mgnify:CR=1 FL=1
MKPRISICSLVYRSPKWADFVFNGIKETPEFKNGNAEFYFVTNNATTELLKYLKKRKYKW